MSCDTEWSVGESVLLEAVDDEAEPLVSACVDEPADKDMHRADASTANYVAVWDGDRQRT